jgi:hypothetical protein
MEMEKKSFNQPDKCLSYEKGKADVVAAGGLVFQRITTEAGWRWSKQRSRWPERTVAGNFMLSL